MSLACASWLDGVGKVRLLPQPCGIIPQMARANKLKTAITPEESSMAKFELSLDVSYQESWGLWEAVREIISNARDAELASASRARGAMRVVYHEHNKVLVVENSGVQVELNALLMGTSGSRKRKDAIGQFGEGLPMALLTLSRMAGYKVKVYNDDMAWYPEIAWSDTYGTHVLAVKTRKLKKSRGVFQVIVEGVEQEQWEEMQTRFLFTDVHYDPKQSVKPGAYSDNRVLLQDRYKGKLYHKGVFVQQRDSMRYGYDLSGMELNRDRHMMSEWDLKWELNRMTQAMFEFSDQDFTEEILGMIEEGNALEVSEVYALKDSKALVSKVVAQFEEKHGVDAIPVENMSQSKELEHFGKTGVVVSKAMRELIVVRKGTFEEQREQAAKEAKKLYSHKDLTPAERENLREVCDLINPCLEAGDWGADILEHVNIVDFFDERTLGRFRGADFSIEIARGVVASFVDLVRVMIHEVAHVYGDDGARSHTSKIEMISAEIIASLMH